MIRHLRRLILARRCLHCDAQFYRPEGTEGLFGRQKVYCSPECKMAAWRNFVREPWPGST